MPCFAAQQPAAAVFQEMAVVAKPAPATPEQRASILGSLALLPSDTEAFMVVAKPGQSIKDIAALPLFQMIGLEEPGPMFMGLRDVAVGFGPGTAALMQRLNKVQASLKGFQTETMADSLTSGCKPAQATAAEGDKDARLASLFGSMCAALFDDPAASLSVTAVGRLAPQTMGAWKDGVAETMAELREEAPTGVSEYRGKFAGYDFTGVKIDLGQALASAPQMEAIAKKFQGRVVYVLTAVAGDHAVVTVTQDPARQIKLAKTPAESVLSGNKTAFADARLGSDVRSLMYADAPVVAALYEYYKQDYSGTIQGLSNSLSQMDGLLGSAPVAGLKAALSGTGALMRQIIDSYGAGDATMIAWKQNGLRMETTCGTTSLSNLAEPLALTSLTDSPDNFLYAEGAYTPEGVAVCSRFLGELGKFAWYGLEAAANAEKNASPGDPGKLQTSVMMMHMLAPSLDELWASWQKMDSGFGAHWAVVGDLVSVPAAGAQAVPAPRVALYRSVSDRAAMASGWQGVVKAADKMASTFGMQPGTVEGLVKPVATDRGNGLTDYTLNVNGATLLATVSDKTLVAGNSPELNGAVVKTLAAQPATGLRGLAYSFRFGPVARAAQNVAAQGASLGLDACQAGTVGLIAESLNQTIDGVFTLVTQEGNRARTSVYIKTK